MDTLRGSRMSRSDRPAIVKKRPDAAVVLALALIAAGMAVLLVGCDEVTPDTQPSFGGQKTVDQTYTVGVSIASLVLPEASGGNPPLTYSLVPAVPGLSFLPFTRTLIGAPTEAGDYAMTYRVEDSDGDAATLRFDVLVNPTPVVDAEPSFGPRTVADQTYTVGVSIASLVLPEASGGNPPLTYSLVPAVPGLSFLPFTRTLIGAPTEAGDYAMTYRVEDSDGDAATLRFDVLVNPTPVVDAEPSFGQQTVADQTYTIGVSIASLVLPEASGGNPPLTYSLVPAVPGLTFSPSTRMLSGTPTAAAEGDHAMTYRAEDADGDFATLTFTLRVNPADTELTELSFGGQNISDMVFTFGPETKRENLSRVLPEATFGHGQVTYFLYISDSEVPFNFGLDDLGLQFDEESRLLHGTPVGYTGTHEMTYGARDDRNEVTLTFSITIALEPGPKAYWVRAQGPGVDLVIWRTNLYGAGAGRVFEIVKAFDYPSDEEGYRAIRALAIDIVNEVIYWVETEPGSRSRMQRASMIDGSNRIVLVEERHANIASIALDAVGDNIYWALEQLRDLVPCQETADIPLLKRSKLDGSHVEILVRRGSIPDRGRTDDCYSGQVGMQIDLDIDSGKIFWTNDLGGHDEGELYVADMDGSNLSKWPGMSPRMTDIAAHGPSMKLYWRGTNWLVSRASYDGSSVENLISGGRGRGSSYEQMALDSVRGKMYYIGEVGTEFDSNGSLLFRANLDGTEIEEVVPLQWAPGKYTHFVFFHYDLPFALDTREHAP